MSWGRLDDAFEGHRKRRAGSLAADGLLSRAISHAAGQETDGFVDTAWLNAQGSATERRRALKDAIRVRLLEPFPAGTARDVFGRKQPGLRSEEIRVTVGPFEEDGYLVHDFLDCNPARVELEARRASERSRKRGQRDRPRLWNGETAQLSHRKSQPQGEAGKGRGSTSSTEETATGTRAPADEWTPGREELRDWYEWVDREIPGLRGYVRDQAVAIAQNLDFGRHEVTGEAVRRALREMLGEEAVA